LGRLQKQLSTREAQKVEEAAARRGLEDQVSQRKEEVVGLETRVRVLEGELARCGDAVKDRDALLVERDALVIERDAILAERDAAVKVRDAQSAERDAAMIERDAVLAERDALSEDISVVRERLSDEINAHAASRDALSAEIAAHAAGREAAEKERTQLTGQVMRIQAAQREHARMMADARSESMLLGAELVELGEWLREGEDIVIREAMSMQERERERRREREGMKRELDGARADAERFRLASENGVKLFEVCAVQFSTRKPLSDTPFNVLHPAIVFHIMGRMLGLSCPLRQ